MQRRAGSLNEVVTVMVVIAVLIALFLL